MSELWFRKLGFYNNPFSIKPAAFHDELIAYDLNYIYKKIDNGEMLFIDGTYGTGKTTILKNIINRYRGNRKVVYYNYNKGESDIDMKNLLAGANPLIKRIIGIIPKNIILLVDEISQLKKNDADEILEYYNSGHIKSVIFVNNDYYKVKLPKEIENLLDGNIIRTSELSSKEAISLIRKRMGNIEFLTDSMIKTIFELSDSNPRKMLENCEDVCRYAVEMEENSVEMEHIEEVLGIKRSKKIRRASVKEKNAVKKEAPAKAPVKKASGKKKVKKPAAKKKSVSSAAVPAKPEIMETAEIETEPEADKRIRPKTFKKNKLLEQTQGQTIVSNEFIPESQQAAEAEAKLEEPKVLEKIDMTHLEPALVEEPPVKDTKKLPGKGEKKSEDKNALKDKIEDIPEYNIVYYNE